MPESGWQQIDREYPESELLLAIWRGVNTNVLRTALSRLARWHHAETETSLPLQLWRPADPRLEGRAQHECGRPRRRPSAAPRSPQACWSNPRRRPDQCARALTARALTLPNGAKAPDKPDTLLGLRGAKPLALAIACKWALAHGVGRRESAALAGSCRGRSDDERRRSLCHSRARALHVCGDGLSEAYQGLIQFTSLPVHMEALGGSGILHEGVVEAMHVIDNRHKVRWSKRRRSSATSCCAQGRLGSAAIRRRRAFSSQIASARRCLGSPAYPGQLRGESRKFSVHSRGV